MTHNCIPHKLLIAKLEKYGLHKNSLNPVKDYLSGNYSCLCLLTVSK